MVSSVAPIASRGAGLHLQEVDVQHAAEGIDDRVQEGHAEGDDRQLLAQALTALQVAGVLQEEGYVGKVEVTGEGVARDITITLKYYDGKAVIGGLERVSKPSCRRYCSSSDIPRVRNGLGTVVLTTSKGVMSGRRAAQEHVGGEIICYVW